MLDFGQEIIGHEFTVIGDGEEGCLNFSVIAKLDLEIENRASVFLSKREQLADEGALFGDAHADERGFLIQSGLEFPDGGEDEHDDPGADDCEDEIHGSAG